MAETIVLPHLRDLAGSWDQALEAFLLYCKSRQLSERTIEYYQTRLPVFARWMAEAYPGFRPKDVTEEVIRRFIISEAERKGKAMAHHAYKSLSAFFSYLLHDDILPTHPMSRMPKPKAPRTIIKTFSVQQVEDVLRTCGKDFCGVRDRAIVLTLIDCGLRASELCALTLDDVDWTAQTLDVRCGKGEKPRVVPFGKAAKAALSQYVSRRGGASLDSAHLFITCYGNRLTRYHARDIVQSRCKRAGINGVRCSPHTLRHTFAILFLRNGGNAFSLQRILGHADLQMTRRYCELADSDVIEAHKLYSPGDRLKAPTETKGRKRLK